MNNHGGFGRWAFLEITDPYDDVVDLIDPLAQRADATRDVGATHEHRADR